MKRSTTSHRSRGSLKGREHCGQEGATGLYKHTPLVTGCNTYDGFLPSDFVEGVLSL